MQKKTFDWIKNIMDIEVFRFPNLSSYFVFTCRTVSLKIVALTLPSLLAFHSA